MSVLSTESFVQLAVDCYLVAVALLVGSFVNMAADRLPRGESLVFPRSHCRSCGRQLNLVDLFPVGGYVVRRGRCAGCGVAIGLASPAVEAACGAAMAGSLLLIGGFDGALVGAAVVIVLSAAVVGVALVRRPPALHPKDRRIS